MTVAEVRLWGEPMGVLSWDETSRLASFEYEPEFLERGIQVAPLKMRLSPGLHAFPSLPWETYRGLPGVFADSLPDDFGNRLIETWLAGQGRAPHSFNPIERLCYTGIRGMGALEYFPSLGPAGTGSDPVEVEALVELVNQVMSEREAIKGSFACEAREHALRQILRVGTSAGGARAKAIIAFNEENKEVRCGDAEAEAGFSQWLLKFDGIPGGSEGRGDPTGQGRIEHAYHCMARQAGIEMEDSLLLEEGGRCHFMTRRFDRTATGGKVHMQSLCAMEHFDFKAVAAYSYEQVFRTIRSLRLPMAAVEEQFRRMAFNVVSRNHDDHVKNIAFLMDDKGQWRLSPAYDLTYSYDPAGKWASRHQLSLNRKRDHFDIEDFDACARTASIEHHRAREIFSQVQDAVLKWEEFADRSCVPPDHAEMIAKDHRTRILK